MYSIRDLKIIERLKNGWALDPKRFIVHGFLYVFGFIFFTVIVSSLVVPQPKIIVAAENDKHLVTKPLVVKFLIPPNRSNLKIDIEPDIPVAVEWTGGFFGHLSRTMVITPETNWEIDKNYNVTFSNLGGVVGFGRTENLVKQFATHKVPEVETVSVAAIKDVNVEDPIKVDLTQSTEDFAEFFFTFDPPAEFVAKLNGSTYELDFATPLKQGQEYTLTVERQLLIYNITTGQVERRLDKEVISKTKFTTKTPALISSFSPQGNSVLPTDRVFAVNFSEPMVRQSVIDRISLEPNIAGSWGWQDSSKLRFTATKNLNINTSYKILLKNGAKAVSDSFVDKDNTLSFKTVGEVKITKVSPANGSSAVKLGSNISITFDQPVVKKDAEAKVSVSPSISYGKSWSGNTLTLNPSSQLNYHTKYTVTVGAGIKAQYGTPLINSFTSSFITELKKVVLNIPLDYQDRALSCEAAALKMALNYHGHNVTETDIMNIVGYDPTIKNGNIWGDPNVAYVGNIDGSQNSTGYGVHWDPIARAANNWRSAKAFSNWTVSQAAWEIEKGNPIVIWGVLGNAYSDPWYTPEGKKIAAWKGEHVRTLIGYTGSPDNPASFIINDPIVGRVTWSTNTFKNDWATFNNSGVVVY